jgi:hypothetical protein
MYRKNKNAKSKMNRRTLWFSIAAAVIVLGGTAGAFAWHHSHQANRTVAKSPTAIKQGTPKIDLKPASASDQADSDSHKQAIVSQQNNPQPTGAVTPVIDFAGFNDPPTDSQPEVDAHVEGIVENGGTCTLTATSGSHNFTKTVIAVRNAQSTSCPAFILRRSDFSTSGTWNVQVAYSSAAHSGTSQTKTIQVP